MTSRIPSVISEYDETRIVQHGDAYYWQYKRGGKEYGPFSTLLEAVEDMQFKEDAIEPGETLTEAEDEIGMATWGDPETGLPAEESIARVEEH